MDRWNTQISSNDSYKYCNNLHFYSSISIATTQDNNNISVDTC